MLDNESLTGRTFTKTRRKDGYVTEEVDRFVAEVAEALTERDQTLSELQGDVTAWRMRAQETRDRRETPQPQEPPPQEPQQAATRLLELAVANADQLAAESAAEAERVLDDARAKAERLVNDARADADRQASAVRAEVEQVRAELADTKAAQEAQITHLRRLEHDHREHLRRHFAQQLAELDEPAPPLRAVD